MASTFGCDTDEKIEIKDIISTCTCSDKSTCVWTSGRKPVYGCPCPVPPVHANYGCVRMAEVLGCSDKKIECNK
jgi:hypothetical protein